MVTVRLKEILDPPGGIALPFEYVNPVSYDIVSDPMVVVVNADGSDSEGNPIVEERTLSYDKALYSGEVIEEGL